MGLPWAISTPNSQLSQATILWAAVMALNEILLSKI